MRKTFSVVLFLLALSILPAGVAVSDEAILRPLPISTARLPAETITATETDQEGLQRAGYILKDRDREAGIADRRERSYSFEGPSGSSATLVDKEYPAYVLGKRELVFDVVFSVKDGGSATEIAAITPRLVAAAQRAMSENPAIVAGLGYLATAAASAVTPEALQTAVIDYLRQYRQPSNPPREACTGCGSQSGFTDDYYSAEPRIYVPLNVRKAGWTIAGIRHYLNGESMFRLEVIAKIPRS
jgi:hypothetical protein